MHATARHGSSQAIDDFGRTLEKMRTARNLSRQDLDTLLYRSPGYTRRWECSPVAVSRRDLLRACEVLKLSPAQCSQLSRLADSRLIVRRIGSAAGTQAPLGNLPSRQPSKSNNSPQKGRP